ncbi:extracellular solute-binding protein [Gracilibacillus marinus]|uniref:Extracellular solute-binding protein n=1 Tax=Gracilibacillus marinus TaxID=630535 RepID=A0ABV8VY67_9BACI
MKKMYLVGLLVFMLSMFLIACNNQESVNEKDPEDVQTEENEETTETPEEVEEEENEAVDLGGRTIRIANHWDMTPQGGTELGDLSVQKLKEVEEKYNVKIEYVVVPWEEKVNQLTSTILAGEPFADLVSLESSQAAALIQEDYLLALNEVIDLSNSKIPATLQEMGTFDGNVYLMMHELNQSGGMYYNKTMFEQAGLPDPYEQQQNGEWTWEAMLEAAKTLTNGEQYGLSGDPNLFAEYFIASNGGKILDLDTMQVSIDSAESVEGYEFMSALYNEHKVVKPNEGNNWEDPRKYFTEGLVGMTQGWVWEAEGRLETPFEWGYVFWPKGPKTSDYQTPVSNVEGLTIPVGVEQPEIVYQIWEDLQMWEHTEDSVQEWFTKVLPSMETIDTASQMLGKINANYWKAYNLEDAFYEMNENISTGAESPSQAIASIKGEAQARVDDFLSIE